VRVDSGVAAGSEVSALYDRLVAKVIVQDVDRERAGRRMLRALGEFELGGVKSLLGFHRALLSHPDFAAAKTCRELVESAELAEAAEELSHGTTTVPVAADGSLAGQTTMAEVDGRGGAGSRSAPRP